MSARKKSEERKKALSQKILETVHRVLYCDTDWKEHEIYAKRLAQIAGRAGLDETSLPVESDAVEEYRWRIEKLLQGKAPLDKSLVFFQILTALNLKQLSANEIIEQLSGQFTRSCILENLRFLQMAELLQEGDESLRLTDKTRKLFVKLK